MKNIKQWHSIFAVIVINLFFSCTSVAANLLPNPGFEANNSWYTLDNDGSSSTSSIDLTTRHSGASSFRIAKSAASGYSEVTHNALLSPKSAAHLAYGFVRSDATPGKAQLLITYFDVNGAIIKIVPGAAIDTSPEWQWISVKAEAPAAARTIKLALRTHTQASYWWDDMTLRADSDIPNQIPNNGFETDQIWRFKNYDGSTGAYTRDAATHSSGRYSAKITKTNTLGYGLLFLMNIPLTSQAAYTYSAHGKGQGQAKLILQYRDSTGKWLAARESGSIKLTNDWRYFEFNNIPPATAASVDVLIRHETQGTYWWDDLQLTTDGDVLDAFNFVPNSMFEHDGDWRLAHVGGRSSSFSRDSSVSRSGAYSAKVIKTDDVGYSVLVTLPFRTTKANRHHASAYVKGDGINAGQASIVIQYRDRDNNWLKSIEGSSISLSKTWSKVSVDAIPPNNTAYVEVLLKSSSQSTYWWDDVSLTTDLKKKNISIDVDAWDQLGLPKTYGTAYYTEDLVKQFFERCKENGVTRVNWRITASGLMNYYTQIGTRPERVPTSDTWHKGINLAVDAMDIYDPLAAAVRYAHQNGIQLYAWLDILDNGRTDLPANSNYRSNFVKDHPQYQTVNRQTGGAFKVNLLSNAGFETNDASWQLVNTNGSSANWKRDSLTRRTGSYSAVVHRLNSAGTTSLNSVPAKLNNSKIYTASAYVRGNGGRARITLQYLDANQVKLAAYPGKELTTSSAWVYLTSDSIPPTNAAYVQILLEALDAGDYWWDDAKINNEVHWGALSPVYPEVRDHFTDIIREVVGYDVDGIHLMFGHSHNAIWYGQGSSAHVFADYGYNEPIVREFFNRHNINILDQSFDRDTFRRLQGEYLTTLLSEIRNVLGTKKLSIGIEDANHYADNTLSFIHLDWEKWISADLIDSLTIAPRYSGFNDTFRAAIEKIFPFQRLARAHGVELYYQFYINQLESWAPAHKLDTAEHITSEVAKLSQIDIDGISFYELYKLDSRNYWDEMVQAITAMDNTTAYKAKGFSLLSANRGAVASAGKGVNKSWNGSLNFNADYANPDYLIDDNATEDLWYSSDLKYRFWFGIGVPNFATIQLKQPTTLEEIIIFPGHPWWGNKSSIKDFAIQYWNGSAWIELVTVTDNPMYGGSNNTHKVNNALQYRFNAITTDKIRLYVTDTSNSMQSNADKYWIIREIMGF